MGHAPALLSGASFEIDERSVAVKPGPSIWKRRPEPVAHAILSAVVDRLRLANYRATEVKRGKPDDVRCRCSLPDGQYVEAILVAEKCAGPTRVFLLMAFDFSRAQSRIETDASAEPLVWQQLLIFADEEVQKRFNGAPLTRLSPDEVDARFH